MPLRGLSCCPLVLSSCRAAVLSTCTQADDTSVRPPEALSSLLDTTSPHLDVARCDARTAPKPFTCACPVPPPFFTAKLPSTARLPSTALAQLIGRAVSSARMRRCAHCVTPIYGTLFECVTCGDGSRLCWGCLRIQVLEIA